MVCQRVQALGINLGSYLFSSLHMALGEVITGTDFLMYNVNNITCNWYGINAFKALNKDQHANNSSIIIILIIIVFVVVTIINP